MIHQEENHHVFTTRCPDADEVMICCDCMGWFPMQRSEGGQWRAQLALPAGRHHIRYYARRGRVTIWHDQEDLEVSHPHRLKPVNAGEPRVESC